MSEVPTLKNDLNLSFVKRGGIVNAYRCQTLNVQSQQDERIVNKIAKYINKTYAKCRSMSEMFKIQFAWDTRSEVLLGISLRGVRTLGIKYRGVKMPNI